MGRARLLDNTNLQNCMPIPGALLMDSEHGIANDFGNVPEDNVQDEKAYLLRNNILRIVSNLRNICDLEPNPQVNRLFEDLIHLIIPYQPHDILSFLMRDTYILRNRGILQHCCADGEYKLEKYWSNKILSSCCPKNTLTQFPYYSNYMRLTNMELSLLRRLSKNKIERAVFVGSGPLPFTSILLARDFGIAVDNVEINQEACKISNAIIERLDLSDLVKVHHSDALDFRDYGDYDVVILAALAGTNESAKRRCIGRIQKFMRLEGLFLLRSANNLRSLVYPSIRTEMLDGLTLQAVVHPRDDIINSIIVTEKRFRR